MDEISQVDIGSLCQLNELTYTKVRFLLSGDFNQFPLLFDGFHGAPIEETAFERSALLRRMSQGNRLVLRQCRRSETVLFDFCSSLVPGGVGFTRHCPLCC